IENPRTSIHVPILYIESRSADFLLYLVSRGAERAEHEKSFTSAHWLRFKSIFLFQAPVALHGGVVSATSFNDTWRVIFMDFLKFSMTIRRPSSGMVPSQLNPPTEES